MEETKKKNSYEAIRSIVERPPEQRGTIINKRGEKVVPRKYHLTEQELSNIKDKEESLENVCGKIFVNPYKRIGPYYASIESLRVLGINNWHSFANVKAKIREILEGHTNPKGVNAWDVFESKSPRASTGKDVNGRLMYNMKVLQRITGNHPYGEKLRQVNSCIDIKEEDGMYYYRLNNTFDSYEDVSPLNNTIKKRGPKKKED